jgi:hypothetical protein
MWHRLDVDWHVSKPLNFWMRSLEFKHYLTNDPPLEWQRRWFNMRLAPILNSFFLAIGIVVLMFAGINT